MRAATDGALGEALGQVYVAKAFPPSSKQATVQMVDDIEAAMDRDIDTLDWMSPETKAKAKDKLHEVANKIGYPDKWRDYSKLKVVRGDALGNAERAMEFESHRELDKIGKPVDRGEFGMSPPTVNAYYNPSMNDINFPAGILQPPMYDPRSTDAENYGHMGAVVGHELTHGFDDQGRQFDGDGNLKDWWTASDATKFDREGRLRGEGVRQLHRARRRARERQADAGREYRGQWRTAAGVHGVAGRCQAQEHRSGPGGAGRLHPGAAVLPGLRAELVRRAAARARAAAGATDPHSPQQFRVNGVVQNMPEFGQAFGCKKGQPMEPENACRVW